MKFVDACCIVWAVGGAAFAAGLAQAQTPSHQQFVCMHGDDKRVVSVFNDIVADGALNGIGCHVDYTKGGETRTVWSSKTGHAYCVAKATSLVTNLVEGNFTCKPETIEPPEQGETASQSH